MKEDRVVAGIDASVGTDYRDLSMLLWLVHVAVSSYRKVRRGLRMHVARDQDGGRVRCERRGRRGPGSVEVGGKGTRC